MWTRSRMRARDVLDRMSVAPFQGAIGTASLIAVVAGIFGIAPPSMTAFPLPIVVAWTILLAGGSPLMLTGLALLAPRVEQAGLVLLSASYAIYGGALLILRPVTSVTAAALYLLIAGACLLRIRVLSRALAAAAWTENE